MADFQEPYIPRFAALPHQSGNPNDVGAALNGFADAIKQVQLTRSISGATDEIQQLRLKEASDNEISQRRAELSQQIGQQMLSFGMPYHQIAQAQQVFAPPKPQFTNIPEALMYGTPEQKQSLIEGLSAIHPPKEVDPEAAARAQERIDIGKEKLKATELKDVQDRIDLGSTSSRKTLGVLAQKQNRIGELNAILGSGLKAEDWNSKTNFEIRELTQSLASVFGGGVAHEGSSEALMPKDLQMKLAQAKQYANSKPTATNQGEFIRLYADIIDRSQRIIQAQQQALQMNTVASMPDKFKKYPDEMKAKALNLIGENADYKDGKVVFEGDAERDKVGSQIKDFATHFDALPKADRARAFQNLENNPNFDLVVFRSPQLANRVRAIRARFREE